MQSTAHDLAGHLAELFTRIRALDVRPEVRMRLHRKAIVACDAAKRDFALATRVIARLGTQLDELEAPSTCLNPAATQG